eukprot:SAG22_NODE_2889_length_2122_cov_19.395768_1_plen_82_part_00
MPEAIFPLAMKAAVGIGDAVAVVKAGRHAVQEMTIVILVAVAVAEPALRRASTIAVWHLLCTAAMLIKNTITYASNIATVK